MSLRATGDNEAMVRASSINSDAMKIMGITLANALVAFAGGIFAQYQNFADEMCIRDRAMIVRALSATSLNVKTKKWFM